MAKIRMLDPEDITEELGFVEQTWRHSEPEKFSHRKALLLIVMGSCIGWASIIMLIARFS